MTLGLALSNAVSGLRATSRMAEAISANLANALTEGYGRRAVELSAASMGGRGAGVRIDGIAREGDRALLADRRGAEGLLESRRPLTAALRGLEGDWGGAGASLADRIAALEGALVAASADPGSDTRLGAVLSRLGAVAASLNEAGAAVQRRRAEADAAIAREVGDANAALADLAALNADIARARGRGEDAAALLDRRQVLVDRLSRTVPVREVERPGGAIALVTPQGAMLLDGTQAARIGFDPSPVVTAAMTREGGALAGLTLDGRPLGDGAGSLGGGSLAAHLDLRDRVLPEQAAQLDRLASDFVARLAESDATLAPGRPGLLTDAGGVPSGAPGLAGRLAVHAAVDPARGGALWRLREGVEAAAPGPAGASGQIDAWIAALDAPRALSPGARPASAAGHAAGLAAGLAGARLAAEDAEGFAAARWSALREAELAGGVDSDRELQMLLRVEQAYAANARLIAAVDDMMARLLEI
jgi:flagellar hook-associated protein 1 FlgK